MADVIRRGKCIRTLNLSMLQTNIENNFITGEGVVKIAEAIQQIKGINALSISNEGINGAIREEIKSKLENYVYFLDI